jgi:hypothetical protein
MKFPSATVLAPMAVEAVAATVSVVAQIQQQFLPSESEYLAETSSTFSLFVDLV